MSEEAHSPTHTAGQSWGSSVIWVIAIVAIVAPAVVATIVAGDAPYERTLVTFPGLPVGIATAIGHSVALGASTLAAGALASLLFFRDARGRNANRLSLSIELRILQHSAGVWAVAAASMVFFDMLDSSGRPFVDLLEPGTIATLYGASAFPPAWAISMCAAIIAWATAVFARRWTSLLIAAWATGMGILAPVVIGQILVGPNHDFAGDTGVIETLIAQGVFGAILVAGIRHSSGRRLDPLLERRLLIVTIAAIAVLFGSEAVLTWFKLAGTGILDSVTGLQIIARWCALAVVLCSALAVAWLYRRDKLTARARAIAVALMSVGIASWLGVTAAMTRIPPPGYFQPTSIEQVFMGFEVPDAPTAQILFTHWRPNILFLAIAVAAIAVYLVAVRVLRRRGDTWPAGRTVAWLSGWFVVMFSTSSGFGKYSAPDFGVHMMVHMSLNMLAPILLVMGGIVTLLLRATPPARSGIVGPHEWVTWMLHWNGLRTLYNPLLVFAIFVGSYYGLYFTGIFGDYMRFHWAHQLMNVHFLIAGYLFYGIVIGVDRPPRPLPHIGKLGFVLAAMPFHAFFGVILMSMPTIIAENFYRYLDLPWADLPASQALGGGVAWAGGEIPLLLVIIALGVQWSRQDAREARRKDRHFDTGRDDDFEAYNRMLQRLTDRQSRVTPMPTPHAENTQEKRR